MDETLQAPVQQDTEDQQPLQTAEENATEEAAQTEARPDVEHMTPEEVDKLLMSKLKHKELHAEGLVKRYGKRTVADHVTFNVKQGEIVGLLGPNGAGKTTSFYMTTGLIVPNEGHVFIDDKEITKFPVYKRARAGIGYLPQEASVFRKLSVEDNIMAVLEMTKLSRQEHPKFIMLDEPFAGVDPIAVEDIQHIVWRLKYRNIGILITDHNVQETLSITDRAYLLFEGRILFQGLPEELAANKIVRKNYLSDNFVYRKFQSNEEDRAFAAQSRKSLLAEVYGG